MNTNPINLAVRFLLEMVMLIAFACWGWNCSASWVHYVAAVGLPTVAAVLWGVFRIPNDPKPAPVVTPGVIRLLLEWILFGLAVWALHDLGYTRSAIMVAIIVVLHYFVSYDRTRAMLRNKPYNGFIK